jgi:peptide/nickel transport system permease protein
VAAYIARRLLLALLSIWVISILSYVIIQLPEGDMVTAKINGLMQSGVAVNMELADNLRAYYGIDQPLFYRYTKWAWNMLRHGDLGISHHYYCSSAPVERSVKEVVGDRIQLTVALTGFTILVTWSFAIPVGMYSAVRQHSVGDYVFTLLGFTGVAVPDFLLGLVLMYVAFAFFDQSVGGLFSADYLDAPWSLGKAYDLFKHLWIPALVLGTSGTAGLIRVMRNNLLDELAKPYVVSARAKGVHPWKVIIKYPVRVAINPLISTIGYLLPSLISGSVIVSVVLSLPTLGPVLLDSIVHQDEFTAGFIVLILGILTVLGTLISDILLVIVDPRIKFTGR